MKISFKQWNVLCIKYNKHNLYLTLEIPEFQLIKHYSYLRCTSYIGYLYDKDTFMICLIILGLGFKIDYFNN